MKKILITGSIGFIGAHLVQRCLLDGYQVIGVDNHNNYYDPLLKEARLKQFLDNNNYTHIRADIANGEEVKKIFEKFNPKIVVNLAGQAGVRYSLENPLAYIESNITGFTNILEGCRNFGVEHLVYASSSSVYGANTKMPFAETHTTSHPISLYSATKISNELLAHTYSHLFGLPTTGLRFFTVYGPWGRPDMALFKFTESILNGKAIQIYNNGEHVRDFTYVDDIVESISRVIKSPPEGSQMWDSNNPSLGSSKAPWKIYNIGSGSPIRLSQYIEGLEKSLNCKAIKEYLGKQNGDLDGTYADTSEFYLDFGYRPSTPLNKGLEKFTEWYRRYYAS
jgi:UDP-glucuronate 4-epimerase